MATRSYQSSANLQHRAQEFEEERRLRWAQSVAKEAKTLEALFGQILHPVIEPEQREALIEHHSTVKHLNSFGKQIVIRMFRSSERFRAYKVDFNQHILKPDVLFLTGTLCDRFDYLNTSPMMGLRVLDIGCGALSVYGQIDKEQNLLTQFYSDRPPIAAEMLQMLGAQTTGLDPRSHCSDEYEYQTSYRHRIIEFTEVERWLQSQFGEFDVISCLNLFNRQSFLFDYQSPDQISGFLKGVRRGLASQGLLFSSPPVTPSSPENRRLNRRIFKKAGLKIIYEGYYFVAMKP